MNSFPLVFGFIINSILTLVGFGPLVFCVHSLVTTIHQDSFVAVQGEITDSKIEYDQDDSDDQIRRHLKVKCAFEVNERTYASESYALLEQSHLKSEIESSHKKHPKGSKVTVYYNPHDPAESVLKRYSLLGERAIIPLLLFCLAWFSGIALGWQVLIANAMHRRNLRRNKAVSSHWIDRLPARRRVRSHLLTATLLTVCFGSVGLLGVTSIQTLQNWPLPGVFSYFLILWHGGIVIIIGLAIVKIWQRCSDNYLLVFTDSTVTCKGRKNAKRVNWTEPISSYLGVKRRCHTEGNGERS